MGKASQVEKGSAAKRRKKRKKERRFLRWKAHSQSGAGARAVQNAVAKITVLHKTRQRFGLRWLDTAFERDTVWKTL
jgi:hypothetical protein